MGKRETKYISCFAETLCLRAGEVDDGTVGEDYRGVTFLAEKESMDTALSKELLPTRGSPADCLPDTSKRLTISSPPTITPESPELTDMELRGRSTVMEEVRMRPTSATPRKRQLLKQF